MMEWLQELFLSYLQWSIEYDNTGMTRRVISLVFVVEY